MVKHNTRKGDYMNNEKEYTPEQISNAEELCELINSVPEGKRGIFSVVMLAYMNGMEAGMVYAQDARAVT